MRQGSQQAPGQNDRLTEVRVAGTTAYVLGLEDVILDRLAAYVHWSSDDDCRWAELLITAHYDALDTDYLQDRAFDMEVLERLEEMLGRRA